MTESNDQLHCNVHVDSGLELACPACCLSPSLSGNAHQFYSDPQLLVVRLESLSVYASFPLRFEYYQVTCEKFRSTVRYKALECYHVEKGSRLLLIYNKFNEKDSVANRICWCVLGL